MGRFYKTAKPEFVDDFIYQPPWELIKESLQQEQNAYDVSLAKSDLFRNIDINYIDDPVEREKVRAKQEYYGSKADELTNSLLNSTDNWRQNLPQLTNLKRELEADYKTGDISKIQQSAEMYKAMEENLKAIKDPARKEAAKKYFMEQWQQNPNRSLDKTFSYESVYDKQDPTGEFLTELKNSKPDIWAKATASTNGKYIDTHSVSKEELKQLKEAYGQFIQAKNYEPYLKQEQQFGFGNYFDSEGKLMDIDNPESSLYKQGQYIKNFEYTQEKKDADLKADPYGLLKMEQEFKMWELQFGAKAPDAPISMNKDAQFVYNNTTQGKKVLKAYNAEIANLAKASGVTDPKKINIRIEEIRKNPDKYPTAYKQLMQIDNTYNAGMQSGTEYFRNLGFNQKQLDIVDSKLKQKGVETILSNKQGYIDFGTINGKTYGSVGFQKGQKININTMIGKKLNLPNYKGDITIESVEIMPGTAAYTPAMEFDDNRGLQSGVSTTLKITTKEGDIIYPEFHIGGDPLNIGF